MSNSRLWSMALPTCTSLILAACAGLSQQTYAYKLYPGPARMTSEIAIVKLRDASRYKFDGRPVSRLDWTEVHLLPGAHSVQWKMMDYSVDTHVEKNLVLETGHVYSLRASTAGWTEQVTYFWVVDDSTGEIVAGTPEP